MSKDWDEKIFTRAPDLWSEAESEAERASSTHTARAVLGFPSTPRYSSETNVNPDHWDSRILSMTSWTKRSSVHSAPWSVFTCEQQAINSFF